ncbi:hypothetical protein B0H16DRAFT_1714053 [Mycena metata]|uniref:Uncharacterized protein n=1 Tax=Mycena metata TaxID=1033252 RepID=A0AAD7NSU8_9AGAR|nr:hypothetical protein B0H16DRAFT_1714053 [Mycena metata]
MDNNLYQARPLHLPGVVLAGPTPDPYCHVLVLRDLPRPDTDFEIHTTIIRVAVRGTNMGIEFTRTTCCEFFPHTGDIDGHTINSTIPENQYILPPMNYDTAIRSVERAASYRPACCTRIALRRGQLTTSSWTTRIQRVDTFVDLQKHLTDVFCTVFLNDNMEYEVVQVFSSDGERKISDTTLIFGPSAWNGGAELIANDTLLANGKAKLRCRTLDGKILKLNVDSRSVSTHSAIDAFTVNTDQKTDSKSSPAIRYISYPLPREVTGRDDACLLVNRSRVHLDLDYILTTRSILVGGRFSRRGIIFTKTIRREYLPQPPRNLDDFIIPGDVDPIFPITAFIDPPLNREVANASFTYSWGVQPLSITTIKVRRGADRIVFPSEVPLEEEFIDAAAHPVDVFCAVFLNERGTYEVAQLFSMDGHPLIYTSTKIFAPSAWEGGASVIAHVGEWSGGTTTVLLCRLPNGNLVGVDVESMYVAIEDGWST